MSFIPTVNVSSSPKPLSVRLSVGTAVGLAVEDVVVVDDEEADEDAFVGDVMGEDGNADGVASLATIELTGDAITGTAVTEAVVVAVPTIQLKRVCTLW
jgi:hypothetical protein